MMRGVQKKRKRCDTSMLFFFFFCKQLPCYSLAIIQTEVQLPSGGIGNLTFYFAFLNLNFKLYVKKINYIFGFID